MKTFSLSPVHFFFRHAGYSYDAKKETALAGRWRCASKLADAEKYALAAGFSYRWEVDPCEDSSSFSDKRPKWELWVCFLYDADGRMLANLGGIDFGPDGTPYGSTYKRVVEAELASEI